MPADARPAEPAVILVVYAHPHPRQSHANRILLDGVRELPGLTMHSLYDLYPDFAIDVGAERERLADAGLIVWQAPLYWYSVPALLKLWFEVVLTRGYAYGPGGTALADKSCLWVTTTGAESDAYTPGGRHAHEFGAFVPQIRQTARFCGMHWLEPLVVHGAHRVPLETLHAAAQAYRGRLEHWRNGHG
jgi:glutathione-regulated potassium-efflux system ancillary protein KefF